MHGIDLGVRGYGLTRDEKMLVPYKEAIRTNNRTFYQLDSLLSEQEYKGREQLTTVKSEVAAYITFSNEMIAAIPKAAIRVVLEVAKMIALKDAITAAIRMVPDPPTNGITTTIAKQPIPAPARSAK